MKESHHAVNAVRQDESTEDSEVASRISALFSKKKMVVFLVSLWYQFRPKNISLPICNCNHTASVTSANAEEYSGVVAREI